MQLSFQWLINYWLESRLLYFRSLSKILNLLIPKIFLDMNSRYVHIHNELICIKTRWFFLVVRQKFYAPHKTAEPIPVTVARAVGTPSDRLRNASAESNRIERCEESQLTNVNAIKQTRPRGEHQKRQASHSPVCLQFTPSAAVSTMHAKRSVCNYVSSGAVMNSERNLHARRVVSVFR